MSFVTADLTKIQIPPQGTTPNNVQECMKVDRQIRRTRLLSSASTTTQPRPHRGVASSPKLDLCVVDLHWNDVENWIATLIAEFFIVFLEL